MGEPALEPADGSSPCGEANEASEGLWKSRCVETQRQGFHSAWESRQERGIPTFPQPRRRSLGYITNVPTTLPKVTFLNGSTRHWKPPVSSNGWKGIANLGNHLMLQHN